jgi:hypothetical protein
MTRNDILNKNVDLIEHAGKLLAALPVFQMTAKIQPAPGHKLNVRVETQNIDRIDFYLDGHPQRSEPVAAQVHSTVVVLSRAGSTTIQLQGYSQGRLVAASHAALEA